MAMLTEFVPEILRPGDEKSGLGPSIGELLFANHHPTKNLEYLGCETWLRVTYQLCECTVFHNLASQQKEPTKTMA